MLITDRHSTLNTKLHKDVFVVTSNEHEEFYGKYRTIMRNLHNTYRQKIDKKIQSLTESSFNLDECINILTATKKKVYC